MARIQTPYAQDMPVARDARSICGERSVSKSAASLIVGDVTVRLSKSAARLSTACSPGTYAPHNAPRTDTAGVDCSAFVSAAWGLATHFTTAVIPAIANPVTDPLELRPGDALNKPGSHVMLFLRFTPGQMVEVMESSGACNGRVCRNTYPLASLLARGYRPVRFRALENDTSMVAQVAPAPAKNSANGKTSTPKVIGNQSSAPTACESAIFTAPRSPVGVGQVNFTSSRCG